MRSPLLIASALVLLSSAALADTYSTKDGAYLVLDKDSKASKVQFVSSAWEGGKGGKLYLKAKSDWPSILAPVSPTWYIDTGVDTTGTLYLPEPKIQGKGDLEDAGEVVAVVERYEERAIEVHGLFREKSGLLRVGDDLSELLQDGIAEVTLVLIPHLEASFGKPILDVPYYDQGGLNYCQPTSLAASIGFHDSIYDRTANWSIADVANMNEGTTGRRNYLILQDMGVQNIEHEFLFWNNSVVTAFAARYNVQLDDTVSAALWAATPLNVYLQWQTQGYNAMEVFGGGVTVNTGNSVIHLTFGDLDIPARPVQFTTNNHAVVLVGATEFGVYVHNSSGAYPGTEGIAEYYPWPVFSGGLTGIQRTLIWNEKPRPEAERQGSIVMVPQSDGNFGTTLSLCGTQLSRWRWDGATWDGQYWDDLTNTLPDHDSYGNAAYPIMTLDVRVGVANVTSSTRTYTILLGLTEGNGFAAVESATAKVAPYTKEPSAATFSLDLGAYDLSDEVHNVWLLLYGPDGTLTDSKVLHLPTGWK